MRKRMRGRKICLVMVIILILNMLPVTGLTNDESYAGNQLKLLGVLQGYDDGSLRLDQPIIRSEVATIIVRIRGYEGVLAPGPGKEFLDVDMSYWGHDYIQSAYNLSIIEGYDDDTFRPLNNITYAEVVAIMVGALGLKNEVEGEWPYNFINKAKEVGIIPNNQEIDPNKEVTRGEMALIVWDTLLVKMEDTSILN